MIMRLSGTLLDRGKAAVSLLHAKQDRLLVSLMFAVGVATLSVVASGCLQSNSNIQLLSSNPNPGGGTASTRALSTRGGNSDKTYGANGHYVQGLSVSQRDDRAISGGAP